VPDALHRLRSDNEQLASDNAGLRDANTQLERLAAELDRSNKDLERFAYVASHDLSEPLRAITVFSQRLAERYQGQLDAEADEYFEYILDGADRMRALIQALLAYSRVGREELRLERIDTEALVEDVLRTLDARRLARVETNGLPAVIADRTQLTQVFQNLLGNALKFVDDAEPSVQVSAARDGADWRFEVADHGIGIEPRYAEQIFQVFERLHTRERYAGTGIGLSICQRAVERHGGTISVRPRDGGGTVFSFTIPDREPAA
jgi:light-regulated signal transduction histidine kinase (bacteriophytochrome)